jgi:hypothetical protein
VSAVTDPVRPEGSRPDTTRRPDYEALAHREGPLPESAAWNILSYLLAGLIGFGLPAWFLDRWLGTTWIVAVGILAGTAVAMLTIWVRYGTGADVDGPRDDLAAGSPHPSDARHDAPDASPLEDTP